MTSTLNSIETTSDASTAPTELSAATASMEGQKSRVKSNISPHQKDRDLHTQIEDLLMALSELQRQHADLTRDLQQEREERQEDQTLAKEMLSHLQQLPTEQQPTDVMLKAQDRFISTEPKHASIAQTKHQLHDDMIRWKEMHKVEASRCLDLTRRIDDFEQENASLKEQLREARSRIQDGYRDRQRLERMNKELRTIKTSSSGSTTPPELAYSPESGESNSPTGRLRELKLVRSNSQKGAAFSKRRSSLGLQTVLATENNKPVPEESLLLELVNAKTAEAVAKQELEEVKGKLDALRKMISAPHSQPGAKLENRHSFIGGSFPRTAVGKTSPDLGKSTGTSNTPAAGGGFFSGWGRRAATCNESPS